MCLAQKQRITWNLTVAVNTNKWSSELKLSAVLERGKWVPWKRVRLLMRDTKILHKRSENQILQKLSEGRCRRVSKYVLWTAAENQCLTCVTGDSGAGVSSQNKTHWGTHSFTGQSLGGRSTGGGYWADDAASHGFYHISSDPPQDKNGFRLLMLVIFIIDKFYPYYHRYNNLI